MALQRGRERGAFECGEGNGRVGGMGGRRRRDGRDLPGADAGLTARVFTLKRTQAATCVSGASSEHTERASANSIAGRAGVCWPAHQQHGMHACVQ